MRHNAKTRGNKPAVVFESESVSWAELWQKVIDAAEVIKPYFKENEQQVAAILVPNSIDFIIAYLAVVHTGHMALLLDPAYKQLELDAILDQVPSEIIITTGDYRKEISDHHEPVLLTKDILKSKSKGSEKMDLRLPATQQVASLTFTSGTTGPPKTVPNTHANHIWNIKTCSEVWDWTADDTLLISLPLSHMHGIVIGLSGIIYHGNTMYLHRWFDEEETLRALSSGKISFFTHAASAYIKLVAAPNKGYDLSKVRLCMSGAAPLPPPIWHEFKDRYGIEVLETYGSSETGRIAGNRLNERVLGSPGRPFPGVKVRLNKDSELEVKSGGVFPGYYRNPQATKAAMTADGYWRTGDIAELKDGYVFLKGRAQETIRRFGYTVSPRDVEWALYQHPHVSDIYVMGLQKPGEPNDELIYFVVSDLGKNDIREYCKSNLIFAWRPDRIVKLDELPRTRSGKARIGQLKQLVEVNQA